MKSFYSKDELESLDALKGTERDVEARMPVKVTRHYFDQAKVSVPLQRLVKANPSETMDLGGAPDPGRQMDYSPVEGLIHKYGIGLIYVASTCSRHCRFCYREELIAKKKIERSDGVVASKGLARINELIPYIIEHNRLVADNGGRHPETGCEKLREILMSGGDPLVLANKKLQHGYQHWRKQGSNKSVSAQRKWCSFRIASMTRFRYAGQVPCRVPRRKAAPDGLFQSS